MATPNTVLLALKALCIPVIYPNGENSPSIINNLVKFRLGEPNPVQLDPEVRAGNACVNFYPDTSERDVTRFPFHVWDIVSVETPTLVLTVSNNTITLSGTVTVGQLVSVIVNNNLPSPYSYTIVNGDTLNTIATNVAALIPTASAIGAVITITDAYSIQANMVVQGVAIRELKRQQRMMRVCIRAANPSDRDTITDALDNFLATLPSFDLVNDYSVRLKYKSSPFNDNFQKANLMQRMLLFQTEFATIETQTFYSIADPFANITLNHT